MALSEIGKMKEGKVISILKSASVPAEELDELVQDAASEVATRINNGGIDDQVQFLMDNEWTPHDIFGRLNRLDLLDKEK